MNDNKAPQSIFDIELLEQAFDQPKTITIPLPGKGQLVMRTDVDFDEWQRIPLNAGQWIAAVKEAPFFADCGGPEMTMRELINAFIIKNYSVPELSDRDALRFVRAVRLGIVAIMDQFETAVRLMENVLLAELVAQKKGT